MDVIKNVFDALNRQTSYSEIARAAGVSRNTIRNIRLNPDSARLSTLKKIFGAMGYDLVLSLEERRINNNEV